jgi:hypothetical protein
MDGKTLFPGSSEPRGGPSRSGRDLSDGGSAFGVSVSRQVRWSQRQRETGSAAAKPMGDKRPLVLAGERDWLLARDRGDA